ncbi:uncharacterized protein LOC143781633 [Ranitomeya variabilis]|uniref:uncharacterized protein LOC143781633 n=1 Tax=Ranitomeya variabilis TaxID=490064 RepID=UPI0040573711
MDPAILTSRRTSRDTAAHSPSLNKEDLEPSDVNNEKIPVIDSYDPTLTKNTRISLLKSTIKKERRFAKSNIVNSSQESAAIKNEVTTVGSFSNNLNSLKYSSIDSQNVDNFQPKRPIKLAPLDLPAKVKEAQMKKITTMAESVYLNEHKPSHHNLISPYQCSAKSDPLKKFEIRENKLPKLHEDINSTQDNVLVKESSVRTHSLPRRLGGLNLTLSKDERRRVSDSKPKTISSKINDTRNVIVQGQLRSQRCPDINQGLSQSIIISGRSEDYKRIQTTGKLGD